MSDNRNTQKFFSSLGVAFSMMILVLVGYAIGMRHPLKSPVEPIKTKVDTLVIHDTLTSYEPIFVTRHKLDSILVPVTDSVTLHDTLFVYLEREQVVWQDSLSRVYASGVMPQVDSVLHFTQERVITIEKTIPVKIRSRWGVGLQAGYGACIQGNQVQGVPYVGVGISYNLFSW